METSRLFIHKDKVWEKLQNHNGSIYEHINELISKHPLPAKYTAGVTSALAILRDANFEVTKMLICSRTRNITFDTLTECLYQILYKIDSC